MRCSRHKRFDRYEQNNIILTSNCYVGPDYCYVGPDYCYVSPDYYYVGPDYINAFQKTVEHALR